MGVNVNPFLSKEYATMQESNVERSIVPVPTGRDVLSDVLREGAQRLLTQAIAA